METSTENLRTITEEDIKKLKTEINKAIAHIARGSKFDVDTIRNIIAKEYIEEDDYTIVCWPYTQELMTNIGFHKNACLINDELFVDQYGSSAYFVNKKWLKENF